MQVAGFSFGTTDWSSVGPDQHDGQTDCACWRTVVQRAACSSAMR
jgi:hypothetical protein